MALSTRMLSQFAAGAEPVYRFGGYSEVRSDLPDGQ